MATRMTMICSECGAGLYQGPVPPVGERLRVTHPAAMTPMCPGSWLLAVEEERYQENADGLERD